MRDGSLYNYVLNLAGFPEVAQKHGEFHAKIQRTFDGQDRHYSTSTEAYAGSWAQCW